MFWSDCVIAFLETAMCANNALPAFVPDDPTSPSVQASIGHGRLHFRPEPQIKQTLSINNNWISNFLDPIVWLHFWKRLRAQTMHFLPLFPTTLLHRQELYTLIKIVFAKYPWKQHTPEKTISYESSFYLIFGRKTNKLAKWSTCNKTEKHLVQARNQMILWFKSTVTI